MRPEPSLTLMTIFGIMFLGVMGLLVATTIIPSQEAKQRAAGYKLDNCVTMANEIGLDPNEQERVDFIKNCFEN